VVIEVIYAAVAATCFGLGWCAKRHSCRQHIPDPAPRQVQVVEARRVRPELPAR
jgi:hypothetical protein